MQPTILDILAQRVSLKADNEETRLASKMRKALSKIKSKQKSGKKKQDPRGGLSSMGARNVYVKDRDIHSRRVIVKARYVKNSGDGFKEKIRAHLDYITRNEAGLNSEKPELFSQDEESLTLKDIATKFEDSPHNFRFIISPEDGDKIDLKTFTIDLVKTIENDLKTKIKWVASCHYDTNEPHVHLVINGKDEFGNKLLMTKDYISRGIRNRAAEKITHKLGLRNIEDIKNGLNIDVNRNSKSYLDEVIKTNVIDGYIKVSNIMINDIDKNIDDLLSRRLAHLQNYDLAKHEGNNKWKVKKEYLKDLYQINRISSIIEKMSTNLKVEKSRCEVISTKDLSEKSIVGHVVSRRYVDELDDTECLIIKTAQQKQIYVELEKYSEKIRVGVGDLVRVDATKPFEGPKSSDRNINEIAQAHGGVYNAAAHEDYARTKKKLPPGVSAQEFVQVHLKRLELLARMGLAKKFNDKSFALSHDFLESITVKVQASVKKYQPHIKVTRVSELPLKAPVLGTRLKP